MSKDNERIQHLKRGISKLPIKTPHSDSKEFEHLNGFFSAFHNSLTIDSLNEDQVLRFSYHLEQLWQHILFEFVQPYWFTTNRGVSMELMSKYKSGRMDTQILKIRIQKAIDDNELPDFFVAFPYVKDLLTIDRCLSRSLSNEPEALGETMRITAEYIDILKHYDNIFPLLVLREHVHLMLNSDQFDQAFYVKYMKGAEVCLRDRGNTDLMFLSLFISKDIPYAIRKVEGFKQFNWDAFDGLYRNLDAVDKVWLPNILLGLSRYIDELIAFQLGELKGEDLHEVDVTAIELTNVEANVNPAFAIIDDYLGIITSITEDSTTLRLATLRTITAIGEAINSIKLLIPEEHRVALEIIINLRDHIVHSSTYEAFRYIDNLINNLDNKTLVNVLPEIRELQPFINELKSWITSPRAIDSFPLIPDMQLIREFEHTYTAARTKDDRSEKLSLADYKILQDLIPIVEEIDNHNYRRIEAFIRQEIQLDRDSFAEACTGCYNSKEIRKIHDKIKEINKIHGIKQFSQEVNFDFAKITLNLSKSDKKRLEEIKERKNLTELQQFLDGHMKKLLEDFDENDFLYNVTKINLNPHKQILKDFVAGKIPPKEAFNKAVEIVFNNDAKGIQIWHDAYTKFMGNIESIKRDQITQIQYSIMNIELLKKEAEKIFDDQNIDIRINPIVTIACEMLYGFCSDSFKSINKFINLLHDYNDQTLYYSFIREHPIQEVRNTLDIAIQIRHQIFHFERAFQGENIVFCRELWFSMIQNMTYGMFFPEAIVISSDGVSKQEMFGESSLQKLAKFMETLKQDLGRDPNTLNMYMVMSARISNGSHNEEKSASVESRLLDTNWYDFLAIKTSLIKMGMPSEKILNAVTNDNELISSLAHAFESNSYYVIPLNVNALDGGFGTINHWVGLYIITDDAGHINGIKYVNPTGQVINEALSSTIFANVRVAPQDVTHGNGIQFVYSDSEDGAPELIGNINDCGPMLTLLLSELFNNNSEILHNQALNREESIELGQQLRKQQRYDGVDQNITTDNFHIETHQAENNASSILPDLASLPQDEDVDVPLIHIHVTPESLE